MTSQNELIRAEIEIERRAEQVSRDRDEALRLHTQEELGADPTELPSPVVAALSSFFAFSIGAIVPLLSYLAGSGSLLLSLVASAAASAPPSPDRCPVHPIGLVNTLRHRAEVIDDRK